jgi:glucose-6-phosphate 1-dehydrogenase
MTQSLLSSEAKEKSAEVFPTILVIFGATGDLARRKLIPALWKLYQADRLPALLQIVGYSRQDLSDEAWQKWVRESVGEAGGPGDRLEAFSRLFVYQRGQFEDPAAFRGLGARLGRQDDSWNTCANKLFYLAVPPQYYQTLFQNLADSGLTEPCGPGEGWTRVIVEKPFGWDLETAQELDDLLGRLFREEQIYRIDHYLGKETARNILAFRFSNMFLEPAWDNRSIAAIHVNFFEKNDVGGRGAFYDGIGALRDVGQNHVLALLALFMMDNPSAFDADSIRRERTRVLRGLTILDEQDIVRQTTRGQYKGYRETAGVAADSNTETYFRIQASVNLPRWRGVPIFLESGKALDEAVSEVVVRFRHQTPCLCPPGVHYTNELRYRIQPNEGAFMSFWVKKPGPEMVIEQKDFSFDYRRAYGGDTFVDAYEKLLLDAIHGDQTLFVSTDEITASWRFIDPIVRAWQCDLVPLAPYDPGSTSAQVTEAAGSAQQAVPSKSVGYIGLGKMGSNMVARLLEHDWRIVAYDPAQAARARVKKAGAMVVESAAAVVKKLAPAGKRVIWLMVPHRAVDDVLRKIRPHLAQGDVVIDGGNSFYKDSVRRAGELRRRGVHFLDVGVSGGPSGARAGACLMVGGDREAYKQQVGLLADLAVAAGFDYMGPSGAGHFVKMVHNGIEYGMMQALGEGFTLLREWPFDTSTPFSASTAQGKQGLDLERIALLFNHGSVIESNLVGWLKDAYDRFGPDLDGVSGRVAHSGEGQWTVEAARKFGIPVPIIERALQFRIESRERPGYTGRVLSALRHMFGGHEVNEIEKRKAKNEK